MRLGIREQILSLVVIPLIVLLGCVWMFGRLNAELSSAQQSAAHSSRNLELLDALRLGIANAEVVTGRFVLTGRPRYAIELRRDADAAPPLLSRLQREVEGADDIADRTRIRNLYPLTRNAYGTLERSARLAGERGSAVRAFDRAEVPIHALENAVGEWIADEARQRLESRRTLARAQKLSALFVWIFGLAGAAVSVALALVAVRYLVSRIELVAARADAYAAGQPVGEPVSGSDEIAHLDGALHNMAHLLGERERALKDALGRAHELSRLKSEFVATLSHEIRTPMNGVIGMSEMLLETGLTRPQREYADAVRLSGQALLGVINDMLDFAKIEAGRLELDTSEFDLLPTVEAVVTLLGPQARAKNLLVASYVDSALPQTVRGDATRLRQVLLNLAGNAVKFTKNGSVVINVHEDADLGGDVRIRCTVADTGIGIDPAIATALFEPFRQADPSTTRQYGGTGLGLAISKSLVEMMGGTIGVDSVPGVGSTFWFTITLAKGSRANLRSGAAARLAGARALVVDDDRVVRDLIQQYVRGFGMRCAAVADARSAIAALTESAAKGERYDIAIIDLRMPDGNGLTLARTIRNDPAIAETPLILMTAYHVEDNDAAAQEAGFAAYLVKPIRQSELLNAIGGSIIHGRAETPESSPRAPALRSRSERILVVEDHAINQRLAVMQLERLGFAPGVAANGREAVEAASHERYDLILMDCDMPVMDGFEATAGIRKHELRTGNRVPIVAMTANASVEDREECIAAGMDDFLPKPVRFADVDAVVQKWLPEAQAAQPT